MYFGCVMTAHEDLAAGLIGGAGALFAAWLAFDAVQEQIGEERERRRREQAEAKQTAVICITEPVDEAASTLAVIQEALSATDERKQKVLDDFVTIGTTHLQSTLQSFPVRDSARDLAIEDRLVYNLIVNELSAFLNLSIHRPKNIDRKDLLQIQEKTLIDIRKHLVRFDSTLLDLFDRKSKPRLG